MTESVLKKRLAGRYREVNGDHPMSEADDAYVREWFVELERLCSAKGRDPEQVRRLMLDGRLPLPSYLLSDGTEMVPSDLFDLADQAGGPDALEKWFVAQWEELAEGREGWQDYLSGQLVCLRTVTPATMRRKETLVNALEAAPNEEDAGSADWSRRLHAMIDELDALATPFAAYDRLRFGGPVSRDLLIDEMRARFPRTAAPAV
ncbi:DUF6058 family natural product biosynthesis protein [Actinomadura roseirufa]|uniref:DUF6058 family natural product biosynthesis protein n=1 Tax=Actinomadura roseirufa TaxID=2094049 RepID=UPI001041076E|nr:DUF6058 family natural product biosynthesis protein [Actinomadura roseirufa]